MASNGGVDFVSPFPRTNVIEDRPPQNFSPLADEKVRRMSTIPGIAELNEGALQATEAEKKMTLTEGFKLYPKAVGWSVALSTCIIMEGYDTILLGNLFGFPAFARKFGNFIPSENKYELTPAWQASLSNGACIGEVSEHQR